MGKDRINLSYFESLDEGQIRLVKERFDEADVSIEESYFTIKVGDGEESLLDTPRVLLIWILRLKELKYYDPHLMMYI